MARAKITLSRSALIQNYRILSQKASGQKLLPMVKANAYGHDAIFTAKALLTEPKLHGFGVASFLEGISLRKALGGPDPSIIVFSDSAPWTEDQIRICLRYRLEPVFGEMTSLEAFQSKAVSKKIKAHIEINTGMNRLGISVSELQALKFSPASIFTHLADADNPKARITQRQMKSLSELNSIARSRFPSALLHFANSSAIWNARHFSLSRKMDLVRPGLSLYGIRPFEKAREDGLKRVMRFTAPILNRIFLKSGDQVGYGGSYTCKNPRGEWIAILAAGYADGIFRSLSSKGIVMVGKKKFQLRGRVSMDLCAMSSDSNLSIGEEAEFWGDSVDPYLQANLAGTIPYELTTRMEREWSGFMSDIAIELKDIHKAFREGRDQILRGVNIAFPHGKLTYILGPSGTGKSVTLKHVLGLLHPDSGEVFVLGKRLSDLNSYELTRFREKFGMVFQNSALFDEMTIFENVAFPLREHTDMDEDQIEKEVCQVLQTLGMEGPFDKYPNEISGGMRKRVGIARAIVRKPEVLLYDEPTTGLDPYTRITVDDLIEKIKTEYKLTSIVISHDIPSALRLADKIVFLDQGKVVFDGIPADFVNSTHEAIRRFLDADLISFQALQMASKSKKEMKF